MRLGISVTKQFPNFYLKFLVRKNAILTCENLRKSTQLEPAVGHRQVQLHLFDSYAILHIWAPRTKRIFLFF